MHSHTDSAPAPSWSGNPIAAGAPGTAGTIDSSVQPSPSQQTAIEDWEDEGGSVPSASTAAFPDNGSAEWRPTEATAGTHHDQGQYRFALSSEAD